MSDPCLVAVVGDDDYIVRQRAKEIYDGLLDDFPDDLSREIIDGRADKVESVEHILNNRLPFKSGPEMLGEVLRNRKVFAVSGTHGKTTTSYMLAHIIFLYQSISTSKEITTTWLWPDHPAMGWFHLFIAYSQFLAYLTSCNAWQAMEMDAYPTKGSKNTLITFGVPELFDSSRPFCRYCC